MNDIWSQCRCPTSIEFDIFKCEFLNMVVLITSAVKFTDSF